MKLRHISNWSFLWIWACCTNWSIVASDWYTGLVANHFFDLASVWNVVRESLTLSEQCMASRSSRLGLTFVHGDLIFHSSKFYIFTWVINILVHLTLLKNLTWNCTSVNSIVDAAFFLFSIVISSLKHPTLISKLIRTNYTWLHPFIWCSGKFA